MSLDADQILDRRRTRRKLTFWRAFAVLIAIVAVVAVAALVKVPGVSELARGSDYVARVTVNGLIRTDHERVEALDHLGKSRAKAVIVHINSPGGTTAGSEQLYDVLARLRQQKPTVVVIGGLAASGGYIAALAAEHIVSLETSLVGSIGVLFQYPNVTELLKTIGVKVEEVKSSPLKAAPNGFEPTSPEARAALESIVLDSYAWFRNLVKSRRDLDDKLLETVSDGRVFTGRQALGLKLVDQLGDERAAIDWLAKEKGIDAKIQIRDVKLESRLGDLSFLRVATVWALDAAGLGGLARRIEAMGAIQAIERLNLDGLLALWHPPVTN
jgi:protease-4